MIKIREYWARLLLFINGFTAGAEVLIDKIEETVGVIEEVVDKVDEVVKDSIDTKG